MFVPAKVNAKIYTVRIVARKSKVRARVRGSVEPAIYCGIWTIPSTVIA